MRVRNEPTIGNAQRQECAEEIDLLYNRYGVKTYKITDEMVVLNERHVLGCATELIARNYDSTYGLMRRVVHRKAAHGWRRLRKAGVRWLAIGIESG